MKNTSYVKALFIAAFICVAISSPALANGFIVPAQPIPTNQSLVVKCHTVTVKISDQAATSEVDQVFYNPNNFAIEGTYFFPVSEDATVEKFSLFIDGKEAAAELLDKDKARKIYEDIVRRQKDPGLLEYIAWRTYQARVFPIPPKSERRFKIKYSEILKSENGMVKYICSLGANKFSPKPVESVTVAIDIESKTPIRNVYSPTYPIEILDKQENKVSAAFESKNIDTPDDFELYYSLSKNAVGLNMLAFNDGTEDGYFVLMLSPETKQEGAEAVKKDIVFILDSSGSMNGDKLKQAKKALTFCLNSLNKGDRFNIINFNTAVYPFSEKFEDANEENVKKSLEFVDEIQALGGTNISEALETALNTAPQEGRPLMIIFITDGCPTIGEMDTDKVVAFLEKKNKGAIRFFPFGIGNDVNARLLDKMAQISHGFTEYVDPAENIEVKISGYYSKISDPILTDITIEADNSINISDMYPRKLPDMFRGSQITLFGRYEGNGKKKIILKGKINGKEKAFKYTAIFDKKVIKHDFIPRLWATRKIAYLLEAYSLNNDKELKDEIVALSKKFGILTPFTSYLVLEEAEKNTAVNKNGLVDDAVKENLKVRRDELLGNDNALNNEKSGAKAIRSRRAVQDQKAQRALNAQKSNEDLGNMRNDKGEEFVQQVRSNAFFKQGKNWIDSRVRKGQKQVEIEYLSKDYFELLKKHPEMAKYMKLGNNVTIVREDIRYDIRERATDKDGKPDESVREEPNKKIMTEEKIQQKADHFEKAFNLALEGQFKKAISCFEETVEGNHSPYTPKALFWKGYCYQNIGETDKAKECYDTIAKDYPSKRNMAAYGYYSLADSMQKQRNLKEALKCYGRVIELSTENNLRAQTRYQQGNTELNKRNMQGAQKYYNDAENELKNDNKYSQTLENAKKYSDMLTNNDEKAITKYLDALDNIKNGLIDKAEQNLKEVLDMNPSQNLANETLLNLNTIYNLNKQKDNNPYNYIPENNQAPLNRASQQAVPNIVIKLSKKGKITVNGSPVDFNKLKKTLAKAMPGDKDKNTKIPVTITIEADPETKFQSVFKIMDMLKDQNYYTQYRLARTDKQEEAEADKECEKQTRAKSK